MECDISICAERILHRRVNVDTGSFTNILEEEVPVGKVMALHPKDTPAVFQEEVRTCLATAICVSLVHFPKYGLAAPITESSFPTLKRR